MAKEKAQKSTELSERHLQVVGSFEVPSIDVQQNIALHLIAGAQDGHHGLAATFAL
jgi:sortase (surface protein transpeptidase)